MGKSGDYGQLGMTLVNKPWEKRSSRIQRQNLRNLKITLNEDPRTKIPTFLQFPSLPPTRIYTDRALLMGVCGTPSPTQPPPSTLPSPACLSEDPSMLGAK